MNSSFWISIFIQRKDGKKVMNYKIVEQVSRKKKRMSGVLCVVMIIFAVLFVVMGITISQAFMLPGFLLAGLYFVFDIFSQKDYEYMMENGQFEIDVIYGKKYRKTAHILELSNLETVAPHWHESVARYKKNGGTEKLKKYDYTSYDEDTPYYTMIIREDGHKIKLLLDIKSFDEKEILLFTQAGKLVIKGEQLHVKQLDLEKGEVDLEGKVDSLTYLSKNTDNRDESLFRRMFR